MNRTHDEDMEESGERRGSESNSGIRNVVGFAIGVALGAGLAILFAPQSGEETRQYFVDGATDALDGAVGTGRRLRKRAKRAVNKLAAQVASATVAVERIHREIKST
jgi:gas vesicle protein